jgi:hypothetical protein
MSTTTTRSPPALDFHVSVSGTPSGPFDELHARQLARDALALGKSVLVWRPSWSAWVPAAEVWPAVLARPPADTKKAAGRTSLLVLLLAALLGAVVGPEAFVVVIVVGPFLIVGWFAVAHLMRNAPDQTSRLRIAWGVAVLLILLAIAIAYFLDRHAEQRRWERAADEVRRIDRAR